MKTSKTHLHLITTLLLLLSLALYACTKDKTEEPSKTGSTGTVDKEARIAELMMSMDMHRFPKPVAAEDFELISLKGEKIRLGQYRGQVVLLSFWATW
ncbi:MAG: hypothetical protein HZA14_06040 [Nitrospirae bacterium]|nr:hypothetical protein [Nitrospirota bacterium]